MKKRREPGSDLTQKDIDRIRAHCERPGKANQALKDLIKEGRKWLKDSESK